MTIPEDPFKEGFEVTDGLANLEVGGFIPLGLTAAALISYDIIHDHCIVLFHLYSALFVLYHQWRSHKLRGMTLRESVG